MEVNSNGVFRLQNMNGSIKVLQVDFFFQVVVYYSPKGKHLLENEREVKDVFVMFGRVTQNRPWKGFYKVNKNKETLWLFSDINSQVRA